MSGKMNYKLMMAVLALAAALMASCSSKGMLAEPEPGGGIREVEGPAEALPLEEDASSIGPIVTEVPLMAREASSWWEEASEALFLSMHESVGLGENEISGAAYLAASPNVVPMEVVVGSSGWPIPLPVIEERPWLDSDHDEISFVTYGLKDIPAGKQISKIQVLGYSEQSAAEQSGVWIGVSDYGNNRYRWYGPHGEAIESLQLWERSLWGIDTVSDDDRAYITVAVYGEDAALNISLGVTIGDQTLDLITEIEIEIPELIFP